MGGGQGEKVPHWRELPGGGVSLMLLHSNRNYTVTYGAVGCGDDSRDDSGEGKVNEAT